MILRKFRILSYSRNFRNRISSFKKINVRRVLAVAGLLGGALWYEIHTLKESFGHLLPENVGMTDAKQQPTSYIQVPEYLENNDEDEKKLLVQTFIRSKFPGLQLQHHNPFYFLRIAQSNTAKPEQRHAALLALAYSSDLNDGTCWELAQSLDLKTAVHLAQIPNVNLKLFLPPPFCQMNDTTLDSSFRILLDRFPDKNDDCALYYSEKAHTSQHRLKDQERKKYTVRKQTEPWRISYLYLQSLLLHSESAANVEALVQSGGLSVLWRAYETYQQPLIRSQIVQIVSNVAMFPEQHVHLFQSGWIGILAKLVKHDNVSISLPAAKALANMDDSSRSIGVYDSSVFLLHPVARHQRDVDVVFVHGLLGGVFWTWRQHDAALMDGGSHYTKCWPRDWLPEDVDGLRVLAVDYDTYLSQWKPTCPEEHEQRSIRGRSERLLTSLKKAGIGSKPVVWVAHSMGGLMVKQLLLSAEASSDPELRNIVNQSRALVMLSVPHRGSTLASLNPATRFILMPSVEVQELQKGSPKLAELHEKFLSFLKRHRMAVLSLVETKPTLIAALRSEVRIVDRESADAGVGEIHYVPATHLDICKPFSKNSFVYRRLVKLLRGVKAGSPPRELTTNS